MPKNVIKILIFCQTGGRGSDISTAINIALKLANLGQFMAILEAIIKAKKNRF